MHYLAIDPGVTTGWAAFDKDGGFITFGEIKGEDNFLDWLEEQEFKEIILERYRSRPGAINAWSKGETQQHIGAIKRIAKKRGVTVNEQDPSPALAIGLRFIGMSETYKGKHVPDKISALAHGEYFLRKHRIK